ncbi:MAG: GntR family transcriptional regulator [Treponema sp.]|jgi:DNA-binding LacI/PurR family transcriptional regulator|nr:GntR family transcriptional regulator [Treponema sp.]
MAEPALNTLVRQDKTPIYRQIYQILLSELDSGLYDETAMMPSEKELCDRFDVERNTVRKALSLLVEEKRVIRRPGLGTELIRPGAPVGQNPVGPLSLFITQVDYLHAVGGESFHLRLIHNLNRRLGELGGAMLFKPVEQSGDITELICSVSAGGIIFDSFIEKNYYTQALKTGIPCISVNQYSPLMTSIVSDNFGGAYEAARQILDGGHERVAFILGKTSFDSCRERLRGIKQLYAERNLELRQEYLIQGDWLFSSGAAAAAQIAKMPEAERPTAVFAFNDDMAYGCYNALTRLGFRIPDDISIVGFDNSDRYADMFPPISTVDVNLPSIIEYAAWYLAESFTGRAPRQAVRIETQTVFCDKGTIKTL